MDYVLKGIDQSENIRSFIFQSAGSDGTRTDFTVGVDISLVRTYAISLQELPLLCHDFLEGRAVAGVAANLIFGEAEMIAHADRRAAAKAVEDQRKVRRKLHLDGGG